MYIAHSRLGIYPDGPSSTAVAEVQAASLFQPLIQLVLAVPPHAWKIYINVAYVHNNEQRNSRGSAACLCKQIPVIEYEQSVANLLYVFSGFFVTSAASFAW